MSDIDKEIYGLSNEGTDDVILVPVETKEPTLESTPAELGKPEAAVAKKKRGRPAKKQEEATVRNFRCSTCREIIPETEVMKIGAGTNRYAVFCPMCQRSLGFIDDVLLDKITDLIDNNPTGK